MERYEKPVMTLEEIEDEVYTDTAGVVPNRVTMVSAESGKTNNNNPVNTYVP